MKSTAPYSGDDRVATPSAGGEPDRRLDVLPEGGTSHASGACLARLVDSLGTPSFESCLMTYLHALAGAEHCVIYALAPGRVSLLGATSIDHSDFALSRATMYIEHELWKHDSGFNAAFRAARPSASHSRLGGHASLVRVDKEGNAGTAARPRILQKLFLFGERAHLYGISMLRSPKRARFSDHDLRRIGDCADLVLSFCDKHQHQRIVQPPVALPQLASVEAIEATIGHWPHALTGRERQVCARILFGLSAPGIALDLGIRPESVVTYKKRAFLKCGIATRHELMRVYLSAFGQAQSVMQTMTQTRSPCSVGARA